MKTCIQYNNIIIKIQVVISESVFLGDVFEHVIN